MQEKWSPSASQSESRLHPLPATIAIIVRKKASVSFLFGFSPIISKTRDKTTTAWLLVKTETCLYIASQCQF
jgi:hypothetical protein